MSATLHVPIRRIIALGYFDGPRSGVFESELAEWFRFEAVGRDEAADLTVYCIARFPSDSNPGRKIESALAPDVPAAQPVWVPKWQFPTAAIRQRCEDQIAELMPLAGSLSHWLALTDSSLGIARYEFLPLGRHRRLLAERFLGDDILQDAGLWIDP